MNNTMTNFAALPIGTTFVFPTWDETSSIWLKKSLNKALDMDIDSFAECNPKGSQAVIPVKTDTIENVKDGDRFWSDDIPYMKIDGEDDGDVYGMNLYTGEIIQFYFNDYVILD
jgi:hypothetical protein